MVIKSVELYLDIRILHDFVDFAILLATDEVTMLVRQFNLEPNFVMEGLGGPFSEIVMDKAPNPP